MSVLSVVQTLYLSVLSMSVLFSTSNLFQLKTLGIIESSLHLFLEHVCEELPVLLKFEVWVLLKSQDHIFPQLVNCLQKKNGLNTDHR